MRHNTRWNYLNGTLIFSQLNTYGSQLRQEKESDHKAFAKAIIASY